MVVLRPISVCRRIPIPICCCNGNGNGNGKSLSSSEELREHLNSLRTEADKTRKRVNNTRLRLLRLSLATEKLRKQALADIHAGREKEARQVLLQKHNVVQALEKSKNRIEVLDKLSDKLNQVISLKEEELIDNVAVSKEETSGPVRIVSPKEGMSEDPKDLENLDLISFKLDDDDDDDESNSLVDFIKTLEITDQDRGREKVKDINASSTIDKDSLMRTLDDFIKSLKTPDQVGSEERVKETNASSVSDEDTWMRTITSYSNFLEHTDRQLNDLELKLLTFLRLATVAMESEEKMKNSKVQTILEVIRAIHDIRERIMKEVRRDNSR